MLLNQVIKEVLNASQFLYVKQDKDGLYTISKQDKNGYMMIDLYTASAINTVYNAINKRNQDRLNTMPIIQAVNLCFKVLK